MKPKLVIIESPHKADNAARKSLYTAYARMCLKDSFQRGEFPIASHLLYTQEGVLDDNDPIERNTGMAAGHAWMEQADVVAVYEDFGTSAGMRKGIMRAEVLGKPIEYRRLFPHVSG